MSSPTEGPDEVQTLVRAAADADERAAESALRPTSLAEFEGWLARLRVDYGAAAADFVITHRIVEGDAAVALPSMPMGVPAAAKAARLAN